MNKTRFCSRLGRMRSYRISYIIGLVTLQARDFGPLSQNTASYPQTEAALKLQCCLSNLLKNVTLNKCALVQKWRNIRRVSMHTGQSCNVQQ